MITSKGRPPPAEAFKRVQSRGRRVTLVALMGALCGLAVSPAHALQEQSDEFHRYIVVGGGPAGLQAAWYLHTAGRDYVVLDKGDSAGGSFRHVPRWRQLISINKASLDRENLDFNLRHDWNSLLTDPSHILARRLSRANVDPVVAQVAEQLRSLLNGNDTSKTLAETGDYLTDYASLIARCCTDGPTRMETTGGGSGFLSNACAHLPPWLAGCTSSSDDRLAVQHVRRGLLFRHLTSKLFPSADHLVEYLDNFANLTQLNIRFGTTVQEIARFENSDASSQNGARFRITTASGKRFSCRFLIMAIGLTKPVLPTMIEGHHLLDTYATAPADLEAYRGQRVLILGRGNGAMEFANNIMEVTSFVHLAAGLHRRLRLAWESHYPGDLRSIHNKVLESYQLKSLDALIECPLDELEVSEVNEDTLGTFEDVRQALYPSAVRSEATSRLLSSKGVAKTLLNAMKGNSMSQGSSAADSVQLASLSATFGTVAFEQDKVDDTAPLQEANETLLERWGPEAARYRPVVPKSRKRVLAVKNLYDDSFEEDANFYRQPRAVYDRIISCLGWTYDASIFTDSARPLLNKRGKYPMITPAYQSVNQRGMFFVGTSAHSIDLRVSAGGFIHGFRYVARALHRYLEQEEEEASSQMESVWPFRLLRPKSESKLHTGVSRSDVRLLDRLVGHTQHRLNHAGGFYQMFSGHLVDVVLFEPVEHALGGNSTSSWSGRPADGLMNGSLPWFNSGDPVEFVTLAWADGELSKDSHFFPGIRALYFEEVPMHLVPILVRKWHHRLFGSLAVKNGACDESEIATAEAIDCTLKYFRGARYTTISLEYAPEFSTADGTRDPFKVGRVSGNADSPETSGFLHPKLRMYDTRLEDESGFNTEQLFSLLSAGVPYPSKPETSSPAHKSTGKPAGSLQHLATRSVTDRAVVFEDALAEDFAAEFYTYWGASRPLQRFYLEVLRRHALSYLYYSTKPNAAALRQGALTAQQKRVLTQTTKRLVRTGLAQVLSAHDRDEQSIYVDDESASYMPSRSPQLTFLKRAAAALRPLPCMANVNLWYRGNGFSTYPGWTRRRSRRDLEKISEELGSLLVTMSGAATTRTHKLIGNRLSKISADRSSQVFVQCGCDSEAEPSEPFNVAITAPEVLAPMMRLSLWSQPILTINVSSHEYQTYHFECAEGVTCPDTCNASALTEYLGTGDRTKMPPLDFAIRTIERASDFVSAQCPVQERLRLVRQEYRASMLKHSLR